MAHFTRVKALGWALGEKLLHTLMNQLDTNVSKAINGDDGGTWAPTDPIILDGDGLQIDSTLVVSDSASISMEDASSFAVKGASTVVVQNSATVTYQNNAAHRMTAMSAMSFANNASCTFTDASSCAFNSTAQLYLSGSATCTFATGTTLTCASGSTATFAGAAAVHDATKLALRASVPIETATRSYSRARIFLQYVNTTYWFQNVLYVRSYPAVMSQLIAGAVAAQVDNAVWEADVPDAATITTVSWTISPVVATRAGLPATMPKLWVEVIDTSDGSISHSADVTDASATVGDYETTHTITTAALNWTIDASVEVVLVRVQGEAGANFEAGMLAFAPICNFTRAKLAED